MRLRVLIFEDDESLRDTLMQILSRQGCDVFSFPDLTGFPLYRRDACLCSVQEVCADIIISDVFMPRVSGLQFVERIKRHGCRVPGVALMSGNWNDADIEYAKGLGIHIFHKPFTVKEISLWMNDCEAKISPDRVLNNRVLEKNDLPYTMSRNKQSPVNSQ